MPSTKTNSSLARLTGWWKGMFLASAAFITLAFIVGYRMSSSPVKLGISGSQKQSIKNNQFPTGDASGVTQEDNTDRPASTSNRTVESTASDAADLPSVYSKLTLQRSELDRKIKQTGKKYQTELEQFLSAQPLLSEWQNYANQWGQIHQQQRHMPEYFELARWMQGPLDKDAATYRREVENHEKEVAQLRQFLFINELGELLEDPKISAFVFPWLKSRSEEIRQGKASTYSNAAPASDWSVLGNSVLPDYTLIRDVLATTNPREVIAEYAASKGLGTVDDSLSPISVDYLQKLMRAIIISSAADEVVASKLPSGIRSLATELERLQNEKRSINDQLGLIAKITKAK
jgi:hypothetical protein